MKKSTGIVRRVDDLGRIVIPHDLRRRMKITEGEPMEFSVEDDAIILTRYTPLELESIINPAFNTLRNTGLAFGIYDRHDLIKSREISGQEPFPEDMPGGYFGKRDIFEFDNDTIFPIVSNGEFAGCVIVRDIGDKKDYVSAVVSMLKEQLEW